jgi:hypothetical protein
MIASTTGEKSCKPVSRKWFWSGFKIPGTSQCFSSVSAAVHDCFNVQRHYLPAPGSPAPIAGIDQWRAAVQI